MTTLAQLKTDVDAWLIRDDLAVDASFISMLLLAEANINRDTRTVNQEAHATLSLTSASIATPALFREVRYIYLESASSPSAQWPTSWPTARCGSPAARGCNCTAC